jgi:hypothetical protein
MLPNPAKLTKPKEMSKIFVKQTEHEKELNTNMLSNRKSDAAVELLTRMA